MRIFEIFLLLLVIVAIKFSFSGYMINEGNVLPFAKQFFEGNWLPNDWYLNLNISYRYLFNLIFGPIVSLLGFKYGALISRFLIYSLLAFAFHFFFRTIQLRFSLMLLVIYYFLNHQSLVADEWIFGGAETKCVAYALVILSLSVFILKKYAYGFVLAGAAMSFHVLVGLYAMFCIACALLLNRRTYWQDWRIVIKRSWLFLVTGIFGLYAIISNPLSHGNIDIIRASEIYVFYRHPHHLVPAAWGGHRWIENLTLAMFFFLAIYLIGRSRIYRFISAYALSSGVLFMIGLAIYKLGYFYLLKYYWFRFPDVILPFMGIVLVSLILNDLANGHSPFRSTHRISWSRIQPMLNTGLSVLLILVATGVVLKSSWQLQEKLRNSISKANSQNEKELSILEWIKDNTPRNAVFLVDPTNFYGDFYTKAQRAIFVSLKHVPQFEGDIIEWHKRIKLVNGNREPEQVGIKSQRELKYNFYNLDEGIIKEIAEEYGITYYLGLSKRPLTFESVHNVNGYTLYKIGK
jgi:hypothetical protein